MTASSYSSLFTAGLFAPSASTSRVDAGPSKSSVQLSISATTPTINVRGPPPPSPTTTKKTEQTPRRRRKSSATIGSSPMSAIKSPAQRAQFAHRSAHKNYSIMVTSPSRTTTLPSNGVYTVPENRTLVRSRRGRPPPPIQKPAPNAPLPDLPPLPFTVSNKNRDPTLRRDSDTLPLPSPTMLSFTRPSASSASSTNLLAPSPSIDHLCVPNARSGASSPLLGAVDENDEVGPHPDGMTLD